MTNARRELFEEHRDVCLRHAPRSKGMGFVAADGTFTDFTWAELFDAAEAFADRFPHWDVNDDNPSLIAILATSQQQQTIAVLGSLAAGHAPAVLTPPNRKLQPKYFVEHLNGVLRQVRPRHVVTDLDDSFFDALDNRGSFDLWDLDGSLRMKAAGGIEPLALNSAVAFVQFSSGTTGIKKGVAISKGSLRAQLDAYGVALDVQATTEQSDELVVQGDCIVSWLPLYHDMGYITALHLPLAHAVRTVMIDPLLWVAKPEMYLQLATRYGATLGWHPNFAYAFMADRFRPSGESVDLSRLRHLVNCSEPATDIAQQKFVNRFVDHGLRRGVMTGCYAMAETTFAVTHGVATDVRNRDDVGPAQLGSLASRLPIVSTGRALPDVQIEIRNDGLKVPDRSIGEIWLSAPFLASGYVGDDPATASAFFDGWYATGDYGYLADGECYVIGRRKDTIIVAGHNVFPEDIEGAISEDATVKSGRVVVFGDFDERTQTERVIALAEPANENQSTDIVATRQRVLVAFGVGVALHEVPPGWIVKSSSGKPSRSASKAKWLEEQQQPS